MIPCKIRKHTSVLAADAFSGEVSALHTFQESEMSAQRPIPRFHVFLAKPKLRIFFDFLDDDSKPLRDKDDPLGYPDYPDVVQVEIKRPIYISTAIFNTFCGEKAISR